MDPISLTWNAHWAQVRKRITFDQVNKTSISFDKNNNYTSIW